ncbi:MAG: rhodanese-like domain-containing protein [Thiobacillaceae bacterium]
MNMPIPLPTEMTPETALELIGLGLATMIDVRQPFELALSGCLRCAESIPLFNLQQALGHALSEEEQEMLDSDSPDANDIISFIGAINRHHFQGDKIVLCVCRSGKRSQHAVQLLRSINYNRCFSVAGGVQAMSSMCPEAIEEYVV